MAHNPPAQNLQANNFLEARFSNCLVLPYWLLAKWQ